MEAEKTVLKQILERFPVLEGHVRIQRRQRVVMDPLVRRDFEKVFAFLTEAGGFNHFQMLVGTDDGEWLGFTYFLYNQDDVVLLVKQRAPKACPVIHSICGRFPNAVWQERELVDLLGAEVEDLPEGPRYPLPEDWPADNFPLRKDWQPSWFDRDALTYNPPAANRTAEKEADE